LAVTTGDIVTFRLDKAAREYILEQLLRAPETEKTTCFRHVDTFPSFSFLPPLPPPPLNVCAVFGFVLCFWQMLECCNASIYTQLLKIDTGIHTLHIHVYARSMEKYSNVNYVNTHIYI